MDLNELVQAPDPLTSEQPAPLEVQCTSPAHAALYARTAAVLWVIQNFSHYIIQSLYLLLGCKGAELTAVCMQEEQGMHMPKQKMWLKRCQRESQEQDSPPCPDQLPAARASTPADPGDPAQDRSQPLAAATYPSEHLEQPLGRAGRPSQSMQQYLQPLPERMYGSPACGMPPPQQPAAGVSGASSAGGCDGPSPFQQQLQATRKQAQGFGQQLHAVLGPLSTEAPEQPRVIRLEPDQDLQPTGLAPLQADGTGLTPDRMLQPWQSLSAKPAMARAPPSGSSMGHGRGSMADGNSSGSHQDSHQGPHLHQGRPCSRLLDIGPHLKFCTPTAYDVACSCRLQCG